MPLGYEVIGTPRGQDTSVYGKLLAQGGLSAGELAQIQRAKRLDEERALNRTEDLSLAKIAAQDESLIKGQELAMRKDEGAMRAKNYDLQKQQLDLALADMRSKQQEAVNRKYLDQEEAGGFGQYREKDAQYWIGQPWKDLTPEQKGLATGYGGKMGVPLDKIQSKYETYRKDFVGPTPEEKEAQDREKKLDFIKSLPPDMQKEASRKAFPDLIKPSFDPSSVARGAKDVSVEEENAAAQPSKLSSDDIVKDPNLSLYNQDQALIQGLRKPGQSGTPQAAEIAAETMIPAEQLASYNQLIKSKNYTSVDALAAGEGIPIEQARLIRDGLAKLKKSNQGSSSITSSPPPASVTESPIGRGEAMDFVKNNPTTPSTSPVFLNRAEADRYMRTPIEQRTLFKFAVPQPAPPSAPVRVSRNPIAPQANPRVFLTDQRR